MSCVGSSASWLVANPNALERMEHNHPGHLVQLLRHVSALEFLFNATRWEDQADQVAAAMKSKNSSMLKLNGEPNPFGVNVEQIRQKMKENADARKAAH